MADYSHIPQELKDCPCWLVAKLEPRADRPGKFKKVPRSVVTGLYTKWNEPESLCSFDRAVKWLESNPNWLLGFAFEFSPFLGGDCDNAIGPDGYPRKCFESIIGEFCSGFYYEQSPSGKGIRFFVRKDGDIPSGIKERKAYKLWDESKDCQIEVFWGGFCTVTGRRMGKGTGIKKAAPLDVYSFCEARKSADEDAEVSGGRNPGLTSYAGMLVKKGLSFQEIKELVLARNAAQSEPLPAEDIDRTVLKSVREWIEKREVKVEVPSDVDFDAIDNTGLFEEIGDIPLEAMYGKAHDYAVRLKTPLSLSYLAVLASASALEIPKTRNVWPHLYVSLLADVGRGKSVARERAGQFVNPTIEIRTPGSDRGLLNLFEESKGSPALLSLDEGRILMSKSAIDGSTLPSILCSLWNGTKAGGADKKGSYGCDVRLSILSGVKITNPNEFPKVFGFATAHGLYDRMLLGLSLKPWDYEEWDCADRATGVDGEGVEFSTPSIGQEVFDAVKKWRRSEMGRDESGRLSENALRVALVSSALNMDEAVTPEAVECALRLMEWQETIRKVYQPAKGASEAEECMNTVLDAFEKAPGHCFNWRIAARHGHWHRKFPRTLTMVKRQLESDGTIELHKETGKHFYRGESK